MAFECRRDEVCEARRRWPVYRQPRLREPAHRLVVIANHDENGTTAQTHVRWSAFESPGAVRPRETQTLIAGLRCDGLTRSGSKLKAHLRRISARTIDDLWNTVGSSCDPYDPDECRNYFTVASYAFD